MGKNHYWVLILQDEEPQLFTSRLEYEKKKLHASRAIDHAFSTEKEAMEFMAGKWRGNPISKKAETWLESYKAKEGQLIRDDALNESDKRKLSSWEYPKYCVYVDGSYNPKSESYGFGVVFIRDGKIETFYGGGNEKGLADTGCAAGELMACMEAMKRAVNLKLPELTIIYDSQLIQWAYYGCGKMLLQQAAGQYMDDLRDKMEIKVASIKGLAHEPGVNFANTLADKLAKKGAGIAD